MQSMREVIRLIRLAALLQLLADSATLIWLLATQPGLSLASLLPVLFGALPTAVVLAATLLAERRAWGTRPAVLALLAGLVLTVTIDTLALAATVPRVTSADTRMISPIELPSICLFIPTVLGGWLVGRRGALGWAALIIFALGTTMAVVFAITPARGPLPLVAFGVQSVVMLILCYFVATLADWQRAEHAQVQAAHQQIAAQAGMREQLAASRERLRLARDLHDTLAHTMAGLLMQLHAVDTLILVDAPQARTELAVAEHAARRGLIDMRAAIGDLRATQTQDLGFAGALRQSLQQLEQRSGVRTTLAETGNETRLSTHDAEELYLIAQEALRNVERHAHAAHVSVTLDHAPARDLACVLTIQDDGLGFDAQAINGQHYGLRGMYERAALIGARMSIQSAPQQGTNITVLR